MFIFESEETDVGREKDEVKMETGRVTFCKTEDETGVSWVRFQKN